MVYVEMIKKFILSDDAKALGIVASGVAVTWKWSYPLFLKPTGNWIYAWFQMPSRVESIGIISVQNAENIRRMNEVVSNGGVDGIDQMMLLTAARTKLVLNKEAAWEASSSGDNTRIYAGFTSLLGWEPDDMIGDGWKRIIHPEDREEYLAAWEAAVDSKAPFFYPRKGFVRIRKANGIFIKARIIAEPTKRAIGPELMWCGVIQEID